MLPHRERVRDDDREEIRALTREQLATFLAVVHSRHRTMFRLLAATGIRVSELIALEWRHLRLDGSEPAVRVRRAIVRGRVEPPKSRHARQEVPLEPQLSPSFGSVVGRLSGTATRTSCSRRLRGRC